MSVAAAVPAQPEQTIRCPRCRKPIALSAIGNGIMRCPECGGGFEAVRFHPPSREAAVPQMADGGIETAQPCAVHLRNAAVANCERCGAFMCSLCRIDVDGRTLCPKCFERLSAEGAIGSTRTTFRDYRGLASATAVAGCLISILGFILGPLAIYYGVKALKQKKSMGETDGIAGIWVAMVIGGLVTAGGLFFIGFLIFGAMQ
jgi:hypothetical protein